ncbi:MAG: hydrolase 2, exosortase A system-associated [Pseudomonadota bacterium]
MSTPRHAPAEAFFLATPQGARYCLFHAPQGRCRGALVYVHPFAEEMNKSRRMAANCARALAASGYGVLQIDLGGCGDSDGEFADARWEHWKADLDAATAWLHERVGQPVGLWGLRLGALLALDYARSAPVAQLLLWQPVLQGAAFMTQFLRLRVASDMLDTEQAPGGGTKALRAQLQAGEAIEIAGYVLAPELAASIDALDAAQLAPSCPVQWIEVVATPERALPPAALRLAAGWANPPVLHKVVCAPFWSTQEIAESDALVAATCGLAT